LVFKVKSFHLPEEGVLILCSEEVYMRLVLEFEHQILVDAISLLSQEETEQESNFVITISNFVVTISFFFPASCESTQQNPKVPVSTDLCYVSTQVIPNTTTTTQKQPCLDKIKIPA